MSKFQRLVAALVPAVGLSITAAAHAADQLAGGASAGTTASTQGRSGAQATSRDMRMSRLIGTEVRNADGAPLGEINDLVIDLDGALVPYAILGFGRSAGAGERLFPFPIRTFELRPGRDHLVLDVSAERLRRSPGFDADQWPDWNDATYRSEIDRFHSPGGGGAARSGMAGAPDRGSSSTASAQQRMPAGDATGSRSMPMVRGSALLERIVRDRRGQRIGEIEDVVVDMREGRLRYAVIGLEQGGPGQDQLITVPVDALSRSPSHPNDALLNASPEQLARAPRFPRTRWPDLDDEQHRRAVDTFTTAYRSRLIGGAATGTTGTTGTVNTYTDKGSATIGGGTAAD